MALHDHNFEEGQAVAAAPLMFLSKLAARAPENLKNVCQSLMYLDRLSLGSKDFDVADFRDELLTIAGAFQQRIIADKTELDALRLEEVLSKDIDNLFNSLPHELRSAHNQRLKALTSPIEDSPNITEPQAVEQLKASITPEALAELQVNPLTPSIIKAIGQKIKLKPKQLVQVLAACAVLSLPSDEIQFPQGPEVQSEVGALVQATRHQATSQINIPQVQAPTVNTQIPDRPSVPAADRAFELHQSVPFPGQVIERANSGMTQRFNFVTHASERNDYYQQLTRHPGLDPIVPLIGIIESNLDPSAVSPTGARGPFQDMGELQGAFGLPSTLAQLNQHGLLPNIDHKRYNRARARNEYVLLSFLEEQQKANTPFWQEFLTQQRALITDPKSSAFISHFYLRELQEDAEALVNIDDATTLEARNIAIAGYNVGMGNMRLLKNLMRRHKVTEFSTYNFLQFIDRPDFAQIMVKAGHGNLINDFAEAQGYLANFISLELVVQKSPTT